MTNFVDTTIDPDDPLRKRLMDVAKKAVNLGILLRDFHRDYPEAMSAEDLLDFTASIVLDGFNAPAHVKEINVCFGIFTHHPLGANPVMPKPDTIQ